MNLNITNEDCMELMARTPDGFYDLAIVDPPYGINIAKEKPRKSGRWDYGDGGQKQWDISRPDAAYFAELRRVSKAQIIWGGNYFADMLPASRCWLIWDKQNPVPNFADAELAYTSFDAVAGMFRYSFSANKNKIHINQKPIALYEWLLRNYAKPGQTILDTHMGSGSIAIACYNLGFDLTACELDTDHYTDAMKRLETHIQKHPRGEDLRVKDVLLNQTNVLSFFGE